MQCHSTTSLSSDVSDYQYHLWVGLCVGGAVWGYVCECVCEAVWVSVYGAVCVRLCGAVWVSVCGAVWVKCMWGCVGECKCTCISLPHPHSSVPPLPQIPPGDGIR